MRSLGPAGHADRRRFMLRPTRRRLRLRLRYRLLRSKSRTKSVDHVAAVPVRTRPVRQDRHSPLRRHHRRTAVELACWRLRTHADQLGGTICRVVCSSRHRLPLRRLTRPAKQCDPPIVVSVSVSTSPGRVFHLHPPHRLTAVASRHQVVAAVHSVGAQVGAVVTAPPRLAIQLPLVYRR
jgi:hypothetical protein